MNVAKKIAISLPPNTFRNIELLRKKLKRTRSSIIAEAIEAWIHTQSMTEADRKYVEGYLRYPEHSNETTALAQKLVPLWGSWE